VHSEAWRWVSKRGRNDANKRLVEAENQSCAFRVEKSSQRAKASGGGQLEQRDFAVPVGTGLLASPPSETCLSVGVGVIDTPNACGIMAGGETPQALRHPPQRMLEEPPLAFANPHYLRYLPPLKFGPITSYELSWLPWMKVATARLQLELSSLILHILHIRRSGSRSSGRRSSWSFGLLWIRIRTRTRTRPPLRFSTQMLHPSSTNTAAPASKTVKPRQRGSPSREATNRAGTGSHELLVRVSGNSARTALPSTAYFQHGQAS
jgi:hypothetical protein